MVEIRVGDNEKIEAGNGQIVIKPEADKQIRITEKPAKSEGRQTTIIDIKEKKPRKRTVSKNPTESKKKKRKTKKAGMINKELQKKTEVLEKAILNQQISQQNISEMFTIVKANQQVVDDIIKLNSSMMDKINQLSAAVVNINKKLENVKTGDIEEAPTVKNVSSESDISVVEDKLRSLENRIQSVILDIESKKL